MAKNFAAEGVTTVEQVEEKLSDYVLQSGDIAVAFSTGNIVPHYSEENILPVKMFHDGAIDKVFEATAEVVEEAVISSLYHAETVTGIRKKTVFALSRYI